MDAIAPVSTPSAEPRIAKTTGRAAPADAADGPDPAVDAFVAALMAVGSQAVTAPPPATVAADPGQNLPAGTQELAAAAALGPALARATAPAAAQGSSPAATAPAEDDPGAHELVEVFTALKDAASVGEEKPATVAAGGAASADDGRPGRDFSTLLTAQHGGQAAALDAAGAHLAVRQEVPAPTGHVYTPKGVTLPMAQPEVFADRLGQTVNVMLSQHLQEARIDVNPPDLGPVEVRVSINGDQANIQLAAPHAATRDALNEAMPRLRASFADGGIALGQAGVFTELPQQRQAQTQRGDERTSDRGGRGEVDEGIETVKLPLSRLRLGLVDAFV